MAEQIFVAVDDFETEHEAQQLAVQLVTDGIGASVAATTSPPTDDGDEPPAERWEVLVLGSDQVRACELLGLPVPEELQDEPPKMPWKTIVAIWAASLIIVPLFAFWLTVRLGS